MTTGSKSPLRHALDRPTLRRMAGARSYARGEEYFASERVRSLAERGATLAAKVLGTREYRVKLWVKHGEFDYSCTCPVGADGEFCKHCVAVGLAWLDRGHPEKSKQKKTRSAESPGARRRNSSPDGPRLSRLHAPPPRRLAKRRSPRRAERTVGRTLPGAPRGKLARQVSRSKPSPVRAGASCGFRFPTRRRSPGSLER